MSENAFDYIREFFIKLLDFPAVKAITGVFLVILKLLFGGYRPTLGAILVLFVLDFILGFGLAMRNHDVESRRLLRGVTKLLVYGGLICVGYQLSHIAIAGLMVSGFLDAMILISEGISVLEKIDKWCDATGREIAFLDPLIAALKQRKERMLDQGRPDA